MIRSQEASGIVGDLMAFGDPDIVNLAYDPGDFTICGGATPSTLPLALVGMAAIGWLDIEKGARARQLRRAQSKSRASGGLPPEKWSSLK